MDIIIIGAGASGLMAARQLSASGKKVLVLEARNRTGGRILSIPTTSLAIEAGAEFIHGNLDLTKKLLEEAGIAYRRVEGEMWDVRHGTWQKENELFKNSELLMSRLKHMEKDISIADFLRLEFVDEKYKNLRVAITSYIESYYAGNIEDTSALSFYKEWQSEDENQYRVEGGYTRLISYLENECKKNSCEIRLSTIVKEIQWKRGEVIVVDDQNCNYTASHAIVTVPTGVLVAQPKTRSAITFFPALYEKLEAFKKLGNGCAIKIQLLFRTNFWEHSKPAGTDSLSNLSFIFSETPVSTWWTQFPEHSRLLTGWIAGPKAAELQTAPGEIIIQKAIQSLGLIFCKSEDEIKMQLLDSHVFNWGADEFTLGAYSYSTVGANEAKKSLLVPVEDTLYFSGEALYEGTETGTVEAALVSGYNTANQVLKVSK